MASTGRTVKTTTASVKGKQRRNSVDSVGLATRENKLEERARKNSLPDLLKESSGGGQGRKKPAGGGSGSSSPRSGCSTPRTNNGKGKGPEKPCTPRAGDKSKGPEADYRPRSGSDGDQYLPPANDSPSPCPTLATRSRSNSLPPSILKNHLHNFIPENSPLYEDGEAHSSRTDRVKNRRVSFSIPYLPIAEDSDESIIPGTPRDRLDSNTETEEEGAPGSSKLPVLDIEIPRDPLPGGSDLFQQVLSDIGTPRESSVTLEKREKCHGSKSKGKPTIKMTPQRQRRPQQNGLIALHTS